MSAYVHQGVVYFAACGQYVKIGYSSGNLEARLKALPRGVLCPSDLDATRPIELIHAIPGCVMRDERRLHGLFDAYRVEGEWFRFDTAFAEHLSLLQYVTYKQSLINFRRARAELRRSPSRFLRIKERAA